MRTEGLRLFWSCCFLKKRKKHEILQNYLNFFSQTNTTYFNYWRNWLPKKNPMWLILHIGNWPAVRNPEKYLTFNSQDPSGNSPYWLLYISCKLDQRIWCCITIAPLKLISSSVLLTCLQNNLLEWWWEITCW